MPELRTQRQLRAAQDLEFCCICGKPCPRGPTWSRQHVPPKAIFATSDRTPPLILPAHKQCNEDQSPLDTVIGQLVGLLHGRHPTKRELRLDVEPFTNSCGATTGGLKDLPLRRIVFRWARSFHAALYGEYIEDRGGDIFEPFPSGYVVDGQVEFEGVTSDRLVLTDVFRQQVKAGRTDAVICYNGKCEYRCTWLSFDNGMPFCLFALRLYSWEDLGDPSAPRRGCLGWYHADVPQNASRGTHLEIPINARQTLDPFAK